MCPDQTILVPLGYGLVCLLVTMVPPLVLWSFLVWVWLLLVQFGSFWFRLVDWSILVPSGSFWSIFVHFVSSWSILVNFCFISLTLTLSSQEAVDIFGLSAIDRLFCFMIVRELQLFLRYLQRGLLRTTEFVKMVQGMITTLEGPEKLLRE